MQVNLNLDTLHTLATDVLNEVAQQGGTNAEVDVAVNKGFTVTVRKGEPESIEYHQDKIMNITVYIGKRMGASSLSDLRPEAIRSAVQAACNIARYTDEDPYSGLPEKNQLAFNYPKLHLAYPWSISVEQAIEIARECEALALAEDKRITNSEGVTITTSDALNIQANSHGFLGSYPLTRHEISCLLIATQGEEMQRDYSYSIASDPQLLTSIKDIAKEAAHRSVRRLGARKLTTRHVPVIFAAEEARGFLGHFVAAISGGNLYRKMSFLLDKLGQQIFPSFITLDEKPHLPKGLGSAPFDDDGIATQSKAFVQDGILQSYCLGVYSARKLGMQSTGNAGGVHNLFVSTGNKKLAELLKTMDTGLLVTELMGQGVNLITGDYSRGASGFWVEKGIIQYPVEEITIAGNLKDMYSQILEIGSDVDVRGNIRTGSILVENMIVAGN
ncbi:MAG: metalloprotease PmbA [Gammaproteobacteria bacterium]|nr:metalloprotease PmbA [Gammaproteobacteria bacterium]